MTQTLIFVSLKNHVKRVEEFAGSPDSLVIALDQNAEKELKKRMIKYKTYDDYLAPNEFEDINRAGYSLMQEWLRRYDIKISEDIGLGDLLATFYNIFSLPIRSIELIEKAISIESPTRIISTGSSELVRVVIHHFCREEKIHSCLALESSVLADTFDLAAEYLSLTGLADFEKSILDRMKISKFLKDARRPISSALVINLFNNLYPFLNRIKLGRLILPIFDASMPKYYLLKSSRTTNSAVTKTEERQRILVLFTFENSATVLAPVVKELRRKFDVRCVLAHPDSVTKCIELNLPFRTIGEYSSKRILQNIRNQVLMVRAKWKTISKDRRFRALFNHKGYSLYRQIEPGLFLFYNGLFVYAIAFINLLENVLQDEKPTLVIVPDDTGLAGRALVKLAKAKNIPTLTVQHSTIDDVLHYKDVQSDIMAVWGRTTIDLLVANGVPMNKLVIVGMPRFDAVLGNKDKATMDEVHDKLGIPKARRIAVWTPSPYDGIRSHDSPRINEETLRTLSKVFRSLPDLQLVVKLHPLDRETMYKSVLGQINDNRTILVKNFDTYDLLYSCEFLMVCNSTTGLEAMAFDKPVIVVNFHNIPENVPYAKTGAALRATIEEELTSAINTLSANRPRLKELALRRRKFVEDYAYRVDGKTSERIAHVVDNMLQTRTSATRTPRANFLPEGH